MTDIRRPGDPIAAGTTGWATETLKEYVDARFEGLKELITSLARESDRRYAQRFEDQQTAVKAALETQEKAVTKAEMAAEKRFEGVNEFRATLADQQRNLMPRLEAEQRMKTIEERISKTESALIASGGARSGGKELWGWIVGVVGLASLLYGILNR